MILTHNYNDLQNIKEQIKKEKIKDNQKIYFYIESYKDTINFIFEKNLVNDLSKKDLEKDLQEFAKNLLKNTNMSYKQLQQQYELDIVSNYFIRPSEIRLKL